MGNVMTQIDKANGYIYGKAEEDAMRQMYAAGSGFQWDKIATVQEKYALHSDFNSLTFRIRQPYIQNSTAGSPNIFYLFHVLFPLIKYVDFETPHWIG